MSNQKEFSSTEKAKFNIEVIVKKEEESSALLEENLAELEGYVSKEAANIQRNPKYLCLLCWCQLTYSQRQQHTPTHSNYLKTASHYTEKSSYSGFAIQYGHFKEINKVKFFSSLRKSLQCVCN